MKTKTQDNKFTLFNVLAIFFLFVLFLSTSTEQTKNISYNEMFSNLTLEEQELLPLAMLSYEGVCEKHTTIDDVIKTTNEGTYFVAGIYNSTNDKIILSDKLPAEEKAAVLRHEECHRQQAKRGIKFYCEYKKEYILQEIECYKAERQA